MKEALELNFPVSYKSPIADIWEYYSKTNTVRQYDVVLIWYRDGDGNLRWKVREGWWNDRG